MEHLPVESLTIRFRPWNLLVLMAPVNVVVLALKEEQLRHYWELTYLRHKIQKRTRDPSGMRPLAVL